MQIKLEKYNPNWNLLYRAEKKILLNLLSPSSFNIEHIGSTAIAGCIAKPIVDILIGVNDYAAIPQLVEKLVANNYVYYEMLNIKYPERRHLVKLSKNIDIKIISKYDDDIIDVLGVNRIFHISISLYKSQYWNRHLAFRDYLIENPKARTEYCNLKLMLAKQIWTSMEEYSDAKTEFIRKIELKKM